VVLGFEENTKQGMRRLKPWSQARDSARDGDTNPIRYLNNCSELVLVQADGRPTYDDESSMQGHLYFLLRIIEDAITISIITREREENRRRHLMSRQSLSFKQVIISISLPARGPAME